MSSRLEPRLERVTLVPDDSEEERRELQSRRRRAEYETSQRRSQEATQRQSRPSSAGTSKSRGKRAVYDEPDTYRNLDESAVPPPLPNPYEDTYYRQPTGLEDTIQASRPATSGARSRKSSERKSESARRRRNVSQEGEQDLTEVAAPPPLPQKAPEEERPRTIERRQNLEDEAAPGPYDYDDQAPAHQPRRPEEYQHSSEPEVPKWLTELYTYSYLIFFAILGTLARLGTQWIAFYPGTPIVTPVIWANFGGSLVMGFLSEDQNLFRPEAGIAESKGEKSEMTNGLQGFTKAEATKRKKAIPLYIGLATGFCGSYTSFSSFARDYFLVIANVLPTPINHPHPGLTLSPTSTINRPDGYSFEAFLHVIMSTIALSLGGLIVGAQIAIFLDPYIPRIHGRAIQKFVDPAFVVLGSGCWIGAIIMAILPPDRTDGPVAASLEHWRGEVLFALVFAPLGCLLRFFASAKLNGLVPSFPLGTFAVNMFGTAVEGMCYDLQHVVLGTSGAIRGGLVGCQVLQGIMDGFCGCLTTVSTWVSEINGLHRKHGWSYAFASIMGGLGLMLVIMGSVNWSIGFQQATCNTGYPNKVHG